VEPDHRLSSKECQTIGSAVTYGTAYLRKHQLPNPHWDAEVIVRSILGRDRAFLFAHPEEPLSADQQRRIQQWLLKRGRHYPTQYLRGEQEFFGREFKVEPGVLIPRPETELLVEVSLELLAKMRAEAGEVLDAGTGSGCIAVSLACELPLAVVTATDVSRVALKVAASNAELHGCSKRIRFEKINPSDPLAQGRDRYHLIVSNPPYVGISEKVWVEKSVLEYEPQGAVFAGPTGMEVYELLLSGGRGVLREEGRLVLELGHGQKQKVCNLAAGLGWSHLSTRKDLAGIDRCAVFGLDRS